MNLNKGCIEIIMLNIQALTQCQMNLNKGCIEIYNGYGEGES